MKHHPASAAADVDFVMPVYNEEAHVARALEEIYAQATLKKRVLVVYDFDEDNTVPVVQALLPQYPGVELVKNTLGRGVLNAVRTGIAAATAEVVIITMADLSDDLRVVPRMVEMIRGQGYDVACASRYMKGGQQIGGPRFKGMLSRLAGLTLHWFAGMPTHDATNAFRAYRRDVLREIPLETRGGFEYTLELTAKAYARGKRIGEVPSVWKARTAGASRFRLLHWLPHYLRWYMYALTHRPPREPGRARAWLDERLVLVPLFAVCAIWYLVYSGVGWDHPLLDKHGFRQSQTAMTVRSLLQGGPWVRYETPVLGPPWSIPFEFPAYQLAVAAIVKLTSADLVQAGRLVSVTFFLGALAALWALLGELGVRRVHRLAFLCLALVSPEYLFWSRTVMIESTAIFFGAAYLLFCARYPRTGRPRDAALGAAAGILCAMVKATTFVPVVLVAAILLVAQLRPRWRRLATRQELVRLGVPALVLGVLPGLALVGWTDYADAVRSLNPMGARMATNTEHMRNWLFGTHEQRFSLGTWIRFRNRTVSEQIGGMTVALLAAAGAAIAGRRWVPLLVCVLGFVSSLAIFVNLHLVHNYYAYGNGLFLVVAVGFGAVALLESGPWRRALGVVLVIFAVVSAGLTYRRTYLNVQQGNPRYKVDLGRIVGRVVKPGEIFIALGQDWNPELTFYADRRALMWPDWVAHDFRDPTARDAALQLRGERVGALVVCGRSRQEGAFVSEALARWNLAQRPAYDDGRCQIFGAP